jgi:hypothetical protein
MKDVLKSISRELPEPPGDVNNSEDGIVDYYTRAGEDYAAWSRGLNMHFGYWRKGINPFRLESMLEAMNQLNGKCLP